MAKTTGLVMAGAVARGAYEAGALSVILPVLEERGEKPRILVGTSAGALNAAFLASRAHLSADVATKELVELWSNIERKDVFRWALLAPFSVGLQELGLSDKPRGFVDTSPLRGTLDKAIGDWSQIRANIDDGHIDALAIVTTASRTGRTVVFVEGGKVGVRGGRTDMLPDRDDKKAIDYVAPVDGMSVSHVLASAAMPVLFPPVRIALDKDTDDWFFDGGLRLNAPIKPAIKLGARRIAIVAADPAWRSAADSPDSGAAPDLDDYVLHFIQSALADPLIEDMWTLTKINALLGTRAKVLERKKIEYMFVGPRRRGELGRLASEALEELDTSVIEGLGYILGRQGSQHHELLSYLLFDPAFFNRAIKRGRSDARRELARMKAENLTWRVKAPPES